MFNIGEILNRILISLGMIVVGTLGLKFNYQIVNNTARLEWIESKLGYGSTYTVYKILSVLLVLCGILYLALGNSLWETLLTPIRNLFPH